MRRRGEASPLGVASVVGGGVVNYWGDESLTRVMEVGQVDIAQSTWSLFCRK